jgi:O-antigen/teichoic acid export membrane protein
MVLLVDSISQVLVQFSLLILFTRFLSVQQFGIVAIYLAVVAIGQGLVLRSFSSPIVRFDNLEPTDLGFINFVGVVTGFVMLMLAFLGEYVAQFYLSLDLGYLLHFAGAIFLITSIGHLPRGFFQKEMRFMVLVAASLVSQLVGFLSAYLLLSQGYGLIGVFASVLLRHLVENALLLSVYLSEKLPYRLQINSDKRMVLLKFSFYSTGAINIIESKYDILLVSVLLGVNSVGLIDFSKRLTTEQGGRLSSIVNRVVFPLVSKNAARSLDIRRLYLRTINLALSLALPIFIGLITVSDVVVQVFFGDNWSAATELVVLLCLYSILRFPSSIHEQFYLGTGRARLSLIIAVSRLLFLIAAMSIASKSADLKVVLLALVCAQLVSFLIEARIVLATLSVPISLALVEILKPLLPASIMGLIVLSFRETLGEVEPALLPLVAMVTGGVVSYFVLLAVFNKEVLVVVSKNIMPRRNIVDG